MRDHRYVDELTVEELEAALRLKRREERLNRLERHPAPVDPLAHDEPLRSETARGRRAPEPAGRDLGPRYSAAVEPNRRMRLRRPIMWRWIRDQTLLLVEILAVVGIVWVVVRMVSTVNEVNEASRVLQVLPTPTATPMVDVVVLPGGHTPPDENHQSQPAPVPAHLRDLVAQITPMPVPRGGPEHVQRIMIPAIGVDAAVVLGDDWESLKKGPGWHVGSANPGERGNLVISGHDDIFGEVFRDLPDLKVGDEIQVQTRTATYTYEVTQTRIVEETEVGILAATSTPVLTLYTCYPYGVDTHRIVVIASLVG